MVNRVPGAIPGPGRAARGSRGWAARIVLSICMDVSRSMLPAFTARSTVGTVLPGPRVAWTHLLTEVSAPG